ncbi:MAG: peptidoglycan DD-metalloendopeptidase family protein [Muribaculum sp.]|nr:peptidoglycan DD-metalloendopeptidase family protein [Muribaculum sp.]
MKRSVLILLMICMLSAVDLSAANPRKRTVSGVKKEQRDNKRAIKQTAEQLEANAKNTERTLNSLNSLNAEINIKEGEIRRLEQQIDSADRQIAVVSDSVSKLDYNLRQLRETYAKAVRQTETGQRALSSKLAFIFSASSFRQAYRRSRYLKEFSEWRGRKSEQIVKMQGELSAKKDRLDKIRTSRASRLKSLNASKAELSQRQSETSELVAELKQQGSTLKRVLKEREAKAKALDMELERLIAEEQRRIEEEEAAKRAKEEEKKAQDAEKKDKDAEKKDKDAEKQTKKVEEASQTSTNPTSQKPKTTTTTHATAESTGKLTGTFESNKGRLLFPVSGKYKIVRPFGRHKHPDLPYVVTDNSGIDIEAEPGCEARAIFEGKVSAIFHQPGYNTIVMIRHGKYLTIYANITDLLVKNGDELQQGQPIGKIYADPDDNGRSILHFEIRKEKEKLNPSLWVK